MLITPFGKIEVSVDSKPIEYEFKMVQKDSLCKDVNSRYAIEVDFVPDGLEHTISCRVLLSEPIKDAYPEPGERLEMMSFYRDDLKLSIGIESESYYVDGKRSSEYDYDGWPTNDGVQYCVLSFTRTSKYVFGVAYIS